MLRDKGTEKEKEVGESWGLLKMANGDDIRIIASINETTRLKEVIFSDDTNLIRFQDSPTFILVRR